jgi:hypothetical protein
MRLASAVLLAAVLPAAVLAGCSSGTSPEAAPQPVSSALFDAPGTASPDGSPAPEGSKPPGLDGPLDEPQLREAVLAFSEAYLSGVVDTAYALMSERCRQRSTRAEFAHDVALVQEMYDPEPIRSLVTDVESDRARVTYTYGEFDLNQTGEPWTLEAGQWHNDDCW